LTTCSVRAGTSGFCLTLSVLFAIIWSIVALLYMLRKATSPINVAKLWWTSAAGATKAVADEAPAAKRASCTSIAQRIAGTDAFPGSG